MIRFRSLIPFALLLALAMAALCGRFAVAQLSNSRPDQRVLLLRTGRILEGHVREISTGWLVSQRNGHVVIPFDQVRFEAENLEEVYQRLRLEMEKPTAGTHLRLADWCFSQKLYPEAMRELRDALRLDASNETARVMLHRIEQEIRRQTQPAEGASAGSTSAVGVLRIGAERKEDDAPEARSLAGLSRETADAFVTRIQPLLANKCGNARCHGTAATNDFRLEHVPSRPGSFRLRVERNLAATLKFVDPDMPRGSRLFMPIDRSHGGRTVFTGRFGAEQADILRKWALTAAAELRETSGSRLRSVVATGDPQVISPASEAIASPDSRPMGTASGVDRSSSAFAGDRESESVGLPTEATAAGEPKLTRFQKLLIEVEDAAEEVDVFDPDEFNRRYAASRLR